MAAIPIRPGRRPITRASTSPSSRAAQQGSTASTWEFATPSPTWGKPSPKISAEQFRTERASCLKFLIDELGLTLEACLLLNVSFRAERGICFARCLNRREILRFAQNDKIKG